LFGRVIRFGDAAADMLVRLIRRDGHANLEVNQCNREKRSEKIGSLRCTIEDRIWTIEQLISTLGKSATAVAYEWHAKDRRPSLARVLLQGPLSFVRSYFLKLGFLDGMAGLHIAMLSAMFVYIRYAKLWQLQHGLPHPDAQSLSPLSIEPVGFDATVDMNSNVEGRMAA
jgi:hypothetical protein